MFRFTRSFRSEFTKSPFAGTGIYTSRPSGGTVSGGGTLTITTASTASCAENATLAIALTANDTVTWSIVGGADQARFEISGTALRWASNGTKNFEAPNDANTDNAYIVTVRATNGALDTADATITVTVTNVNEAPVITSDGGGATASVSVAENTTAVTTVTATDVDAGATLTYSISGGADASKFSIGSSSGALTFQVAPDFEVPTDANTDNAYIVIVQVSDGSLTDTQTITVTVTDAAEGGGSAPTYYILGF